MRSLHATLRLRGRARENRADAERSRGVSNVSSYRVYFLDGAGRLELPDWIEAADDAEALCQAQELKNYAQVSNLASCFQARRP